MKGSNTGLVFAIIFMCMAVLLDSRFNDLAAISNLQMQYNFAMDNAVEAAMDRLVEVDNGWRKKLNKEEAVKCFYDSLAINLGVFDNRNLREKLKGYVPVVGVILDDGFYLYCDKEKIVDGERIVVKEFSKKYPYQYYDKNITYYFTLTDYVRMIDETKKEYYEGDYHDLGMLFRNSIMNDNAEFDRVRRMTIINTLTDTIEMYINEHNKIAWHYGIQYHFALPYIEREDWYRTIDDISMIALFQGYPYGNNITGTYNRFAFAGARIHKNKSID